MHLATSYVNQLGFSSLFQSVGSEAAVLQGTTGEAAVLQGTIR